MMEGSSSGDHSFLIEIDTCHTRGYKSIFKKIRLKNRLTFFSTTGFWLRRQFVPLNFHFLSFEGVGRTCDFLTENVFNKNNRYFVPSVTGQKRKRHPNNGKL